MAARALHQRFDEVRRTEWLRLGRKVGPLEPAQRDALEGIVAEVVQALANPPMRRLVETDEPALSAAALQLFGIPIDRVRLSTR